ncbi:folate-binding protein [Sphingomonas sp. 1P06PA]|uniref:CAF17-like 4Fe-4S cluster assembly/insertion protein YgfZ n=1 Tax=Sphingomonas sp. 1P06PA TaxID=554121 RepID=UPI0039A63DB9
MSATTLRDRALIRLAGADVRPFLDGLVTNALPESHAPAPVWAGLLTPQGKALFDFMIWSVDDDLLIDCEAAQAEALARRLAMYRLRRVIEIAPEPGLAVHWAPLGDALHDPRGAMLGTRWLAPVADGDASSAWRAHRLGYGVAEGVSELGSDKTLWLEANARELNGVSFTKGCYVGQENTARMHHRAKVNRRLVVARTDVDPGDAARIWYPDLALGVGLVRVEALPAIGWGDVLMPGWLEEATAAG